MGFLTGVLSSQAAAALNSQEQAIVDQMANASGQNRAFLKVDPILSQVARARAADMARRNYFSHENPDGYGPNYLVRQAGYPLPPVYSTGVNANNVESIAAGRESASATWSDWMNSSAHKRHLLGEAAFYAEQTAIGVGYFYAEGSEYRAYWVVITAPPSASVTLTIKSPAANAQLGESQVNVSGTSEGGTPVHAVQVRVENADGASAYQPASGTANWSVSIAGLVPGPNTIRVQALDAGGKVIAQSARKVQYVVSTELLVEIQGEGRISNGFLGATSRAVGRKYTIIAQPSAGWLFTGWTGGISSAQPKLTFTMVEGLVLVATFAPNPFTMRKGTYLGLLQGADEVSAESTGRLQLKLNESGSFTGSVVLGGVRYALKGKFNVAGIATVELGRSGALADLRLDIEGSSGLSATVTKGETASTTIASLGLPKTGVPYANAGRFTVSISAHLDDPNPDVPAGNGYGTLRVDGNRRGSLVGSLPDGRGFSVSGNFAADGTMTVYAPLYAGRGVLAGRLAFSETEVSDIEGSVLWIKPQTSGIHSNAFASESCLLACRYLPPSVGQPVFEVAAAENNAMLSLSEGDLEAPVEQPLTLETTNRVRLSAPELEGMRVTMNPATGIFSGSFVHPATGMKTRIGGAIFQKQGAGFGYFLGVQESGHTSLTPAN